MPKEDIEAAPVCPGFKSVCSDQLGDLAAKVIREFDNLELSVESKSAEQEMDDHHATKMQKEGFEPGLVCPSFNSYCCSDKLADIVVKVFGEFDNLTSLERESEDHAGDDDFTFVSLPQWGDKFFFGPVFPVFNRDLLLDEISQRHLKAMEEKSKSTAGTAPSKRLKLRELFQEDDGSSLALPSSTSTTRRSSANDWKLRDILLQTNSEGETMSSSRSSMKKQQRRSWVDRCLGHMRLCFSSS